MTKRPKILIAGGGTGGHIYPLLEVARLLAKRNKVDLLYVGGKGNLEEEIVPDQLPFKSISVGKLRRHFTLLHIRDGVRVIKGLFEAGRIIKGFKPDLIFTKGGYVSLPILAIASRTDIPVISHESDSVIGLSNRLAVRIAQKICLGFPIKYYPKTLVEKAVYTGIPIRPGFRLKPTAKDKQLFSLKKNLPVLLIACGSQGAEALNNAIEPLLPSLLQRVQIIHLTGPSLEKFFSEYRNKLPQEIRQNYHPFGFLKEGMEAAVRVSDLVVSRAGSTIAELAAAGRPMILVPLPTAAGNHQVKNAEIYTKEGAAVAIRQNFLTPERLGKTITTLLNDRHRLRAMSTNAGKLARPDATDNVVRVIEEQLRKINRG